MSRETETWGTWARSFDLFSWGLFALGVCVALALIQVPVLIYLYNDHHPSPPYIRCQSCGTLLDGARRQ